MMPLVATNEERLSFLQNTQDHSLKSFRMRSLTPSFPRQKNKQFLRLDLAWKKFLKTSQILPDDEEDEIPWHEEQPEELK